ncbi:MAG: fibronectin type III domain-containing protein [Coriobacteriales bacterium]
MTTASRIGSSKALKLALSAAMASTMAVGWGAWLPQQALAATADTSWYDASKESFTLRDARDLAGLAQLVNSGKASFEGKTVSFKEGTSLKLDSSYVPVGNAKNAFEGTFEGNGLNVTGLAISSGTQYLGLFGHAGASSTISNVKVSGKISLSVSKASKSIVSYVGGVAGYTAGDLVNCDSAVDISVSSDVVSTLEKNATVYDVGGVAGRAMGNLTGCDTLKSGSVYVTSSSGPASDDISWVVAYVGGVVGNHGPDVTLPDVTPTEAILDGLANPSSITSCTNKAQVRILVTAAGEKDRFGNDTFANSRFLGGIAGYSSGNIASCSNSGAVDSANYSKKGKALNAYGTVATGGIVGGLRIDKSVAAYTDTEDPGYRYEQVRGEEPWITVSDCTNSGLVFGMAQAGGIVGQAGAYTYITRCANSGNVEGSRYTKPSPGGIAGRSFGDISYCYNTGDVKSTTGGGYYAAGIVGMYHSIGNDSKGNPIEPECWACYNTGYVLTTGSFRSGAVVGELDGGYIHDTFSLANRNTGNCISGLNDFTGVIANSVKLVEETELSSASSLAILNACCDKEGWPCYYTLPAGKAYGSGAHPVLATGPVEGAASLDGKTAEQISAKAATYSASIDPVPSVTLTMGGQKLVQNADFRVIAQEGTKGANAGSTKYTAHIQGIGHYSGTLATTVQYTIAQASIKSCTLTAEARYFNYAPQRPASVKLYDDGGNLVDESEYSWTINEELVGTAAPSGRYYYQDAHDKTAAEGDPVIVTAAANGNYKGEETFNVFKIKAVPFVHSVDSDNPNQGSFNVGKVLYTDPQGIEHSWKFEEVCSYGTNNAIGSSDIRGAMKVKYTGQPIKATLSDITYMGKELVELKDGDPWYDNPKAYGYKLLYGNPNPEDAATAGSELDSVTNVTGTDYAVFTIRSAPYSNFDNYITVWFEITPASIEDDVTIEGFEESVSYITGKQDAAKLTYNGMTLVEGRDYTATYSYDGSNATVTYTGMGNYSGSVTKSFQFSGSVVSAPKLTSAKSAKKAKLTVKWSAASAKAAAVTGYEVRYKTGSGAWKTKVVKGAKASSVTLSLKSKKTYKVQVRAYKSAGTVTNYTPWSAAKSAKTK